MLGWTLRHILLLSKQVDLEDLHAGYDETNKKQVPTW